MISITCGILKRQTHKVEVRVLAARGREWGKWGKVGQRVEFQFRRISQFRRSKLQDRNYIAHNSVLCT